MESKEFPNQWKNDPESHAQANLTLNTFAHETVDLSRFPNLILDNYEQDYLIQEDVKKPAEQFQSFHFHHASAGKNLNEYFFTNEQTNKQTNEWMNEWMNESYAKKNNSVMEWDNANFRYTTHWNCKKKYHCPIPYRISREKRQLRGDNRETSKMRQYTETNRYLSHQSQPQRSALPRLQMVSAFFSY